ncbi:hypothetical protein [Flexivirga sp. B27]
MLKLMLLLHLVTAIFAVGPLVHAVTTASRGLRRGDGDAVESSARMAKIYSIASVLVVVFGFGLMSQKRRGKELASFGDTWIWLSLVLWAVAIVVTFVVIVPSLDRAAETLRAPSESGDEPSRSSSPEERSGGGRIETSAAAVSSYTARVAASGGVVGIIFVVIVVLMVYRPGS